MKTSIATINQTEFIRYIEEGATKLTAREVQLLVSEIPDLRERFSALGASGFVNAEPQLSFLAEVVQAVWTDRYREMSYRASLEAAFALTYFLRDVDLIPDGIEEIGYADDAAVVHTVFGRNAVEYERFAVEAKLEWSTLAPKLP